jgi:hypothetical protein
VRFLFTIFERQTLSDDISHYSLDLRIRWIFEGHENVKSDEV